MRPDSCTKSHMASGRFGGADGSAMAGRPRDSRRDAGRYQARRSANARMIQVRHRSHATYSRQPRQVRKEATVTGSCVCSGSPVPGFFSALICSCPSDYQHLQVLYDSFRNNRPLAASSRSRCGRIVCLGSQGETRDEEESWYFPPVRSPCHHPRIWKTVSGTSTIFGPVGPLRCRLPLVASTESCALGGVGPGCSVLSDRRRKSGFQHCLLPQFHPRVDGSRERTRRRLMGIRRH